MTILRPLDARALGLILTTAARRYRARAHADRAPLAADLQELRPNWLRFVLDNDGG